MTAMLCGCAALASGCIPAPFEPSKISLPTHFQRTAHETGEAAWAAIDAPTTALAAVSTPDDFAARGWDCRPSPIPGRIVCSHPQQSFPVAAFPPDVPPEDRPVTVTLLAWEDGVFAGMILLIRPEIYREQPCSSTGEPYVLRPIIGYYECLNRTGR
jgi:hypothetical protein